MSYQRPPAYTHGMGFRSYVFLWLIFLACLVYEALALNFSPEQSVSQFLRTHTDYFSDLNLSPHPGRPISLFYGWTGIGLIVATNLYIFRKRLRFLQKIGSLPGWLDFHIFCGMLGPTFIIFHTNFKVDGLVAISFWSMIVVAVSGIIGRYFYSQVLQKKVDIEREILQSEKALEQLASRPDFGALKEQALAFVGGKSLTSIRQAPASAATSLFGSLIGDAKLMFTLPGAHTDLTHESRSLLKTFALAKRHLFFFESFQQWLGYWHSFHLPFAFFMYIVAVIHIISAMIFGVRG